MSHVLYEFRDSLLNKQVSDHMKIFDETVEKEAVLMGAVPHETLTKRESEHDMNNLSSRENNNNNSAEWHADVATEEGKYAHEARVLQRIQTLHDERMRRERERLSRLDQLAAGAEGRIHRYFENVEHELRSKMKSRSLDASHRFGDAVLQHPGAITLDPERVDWTQLNQQVEMNVVGIRGLRNKIPAGRYVLVVSKLSQLGGTHLPWSKRTATSRFPPACYLHSEEDDDLETRLACEVCCGKVGCTVPVDFAADPKDHTMDLSSTLYTFMPPATRIKPYNVFLFELVLLPPSGEGEEDKKHDYHNKSSGGGDKSLLQQHRHRPNTVGWAAFPAVNGDFNIVKGRFRIPMLRGNVRDGFRHHHTMMTWMMSDLENWLANLYIEVYPKPRVHFGRDEFALQSKALTKLLRLEGRSGEEGGWSTPGAQRAVYLWGRLRKEIMSRSAARKNAILKAQRRRSSSVNNNTVNSTSEYFTSLSSSSFNFGGNNHLFNNSDDIEDSEAYLEAATALSDASSSKKKSTSVQWSTFTPNANGSASGTLRHSTWVVQLQYCWRAVRDELSLRDPWDPKFYLVILVTAMSLYAQLFLHGVGVYIGLQILDVPVLTSSPEYYGFAVTYRSFFTSAFEEIFIALCGQLMNLFSVLTLIGASVLFRAATGSYPDQISKFVFTSSFAMLLVPFLDLIISRSLGKEFDDITRLLEFARFHKFADFIGIGCFLIIYLNMSALMLVAFFVFTMRVHMNGTLQDCFWRVCIARDEESFFVPGDFEVSMAEVSWVLSRAERWRGSEGQRRKVVVEEMITTDEHDLDFEKKELRVAVYELPVGATSFDRSLWMSSRKSTLFREFLILEDGTIMEAIHDDPEKEEAETARALMLWQGVSKRSSMSSSIRRRRSSAFPNQKA